MRAVSEAAFTGIFLRGRMLSDMLRLLHLYKGQKALHSVEISAVMQAQRKQRVDESHIKIVEGIYSGSTATIGLHKESNKIPINKAGKYHLI